MSPATMEDSSNLTVDKDAEVLADAGTPRPLPMRIRELSWATWRGVARRSVLGYFQDGCTDFAGSMTYSAVTALIPSLVVVVSLVNLVTNGQAAVDAVVAILNDLGVGSIVANSGVRSVLDSLLVRQDSASVLLGSGLFVAISSGSGYIAAFTRASNRIYGVREGRPWWKLQMLQYSLAAVALVLLAVEAAGLVLSGPMLETFGERVHIGAAARLAWSAWRWPVLVFIAVLLLSLLFWVAPNVQQPRVRWLTVGGAVALIVWAAASFGFGVYVANFGSYDRTYGSLGAVMAFLVWLYLSNSALLLGVQVNAEVQRGRLIQAGDPDPEAPLKPRAS